MTVGRFRRPLQTQSEYFATNNPLVSWAHAVSAMRAMYGARGIWPLGDNQCLLGANDILLDVTANLLHCQANAAGTVLRGMGTSGVLAPVISYAAAGNTIGIGVNNLYNPIPATTRGVTCFCWAKLSVPLAATNPILIDKSATANQFSYSLDVINFTPRFRVSSNGIAIGTATGAAQTQAFYAEWHFYCGRYQNGGGAFDVIHDNLIVASGAPPATIFQGASSFYIGRTMAAGDMIALPFLSIGALSDTEILAFYELTRPLFGNARP